LPSDFFIAVGKHCNSLVLLLVVGIAQSVKRPVSVSEFGLIPDWGTNLFTSHRVQTGSVIFVLLRYQSEKLIVLRTSGEMKNGRSFPSAAPSLYLVCC
jgi:hypothetical protein